MCETGPENDADPPRERSRRGLSATTGPVTAQNPRGRVRPCRRRAAAPARNRSPDPGTSTTAPASSTRATRSAPRRRRRRPRSPKHSSTPRSNSTASTGPRRWRSRRRASGLAAELLAERLLVPDALARHIEKTVRVRLLGHLPREIEKRRRDGPDHDRGRRRQGRGAPENCASNADRTEPRNRRGRKAMSEQRTSRVELSTRDGGRLDETTVSTDEFATFLDVLALSPIGTTIANPGDIGDPCTTRRRRAPTTSSDQPPAGALVRSRSASANERRGATRGSASATARSEGANHARRSGGSFLA